MSYTPIRTEVFDFREDDRRAFTVYEMPDGRVYLKTKDEKVYSGLHLLTFHGYVAEMVPMTKSQVKATYLKDISYPALETHKGQNYLSFDGLVGGERMRVYAKLVTSNLFSFACDNRRVWFQMNSNTLEVKGEYGCKYEGPCMWNGSRRGIYPVTTAERALVDPEKISSAALDLTDMKEEYLRIVIGDIFVYYKVVHQV